MKGGQYLCEFKQFKSYHNSKKKSLVLTEPFSNITKINPMAILLSNVPMINSSHYLLGACMSIPNLTNEILKKYSNLVQFSALGKNKHLTELSLISYILKYHLEIP